MVIQFRKYLNSGLLLSDLVFITSSQFIDTLGEGSHYQQTGELDIELKINGVDINPEEFLNSLDAHIRKHENKFENWKQKWISKNSDASKKEQIKVKLDKIYNELKNLQDKIE